MASQEALARRRAGAQARVDHCRELLRRQLRLTPPQPGRGLHKGDLAQVVAWEEMAGFLEGVLGALGVPATHDHAIAPAENFRVQRPEAIGGAIVPQGVLEPLAMGVDQPATAGNPLLSPGGSESGTQPAQEGEARRRTIRRRPTEREGSTS